MIIDFSLNSRHCKELEIILTYNAYGWFGAYRIMKRFCNAYNLLHVYAPNYHNIGLHAWEACQITANWQDTLSILKFSKDIQNALFCQVFTSVLKKSHTKPAFHKSDVTCATETRKNMNLPYSICTESHNKTNLA